MKGSVRVDYNYEAENNSHYHTCFFYFNVIQKCGLCYRPTLNSLAYSISSTSNTTQTRFYSAIIMYPNESRGETISG